MPRKLPPSFKVGERLTAKKLNELSRILGRLDKQSANGAIQTEGYYSSRPQDPTQVSFLAKTPGGGIPAMTGTSFPYTLGSAECDIVWIDYSNMTLVDSGFTMTVYNSTSSDVEGDRIIQGKWIARMPFVDVEDCAG